MQKIGKKVPGVVIAGLSGGSGKTIISLGIAAAWEKSGLTVSIFKKGPDYIDAGWLSKAVGRPCYNLDTFLCRPDVVQQSYLENSEMSDVAVVEGNRGLYDGIDTDGSTSTAELAKLLNLPILLVLDCTKSTRTMAALLMGCMNFDPEIRICGVILNRVAGKRHEAKVRANIEKFCRIPVLGAVPKLNAKDFPERHMGLVTSAEHTFSDQAVTAAIALTEAHIDLKGLYQILNLGKNNTVRIPVPEVKHVDSPSEENKESGVAIGIIRDLAFQFYYPENIDALKRLGAKIIYISPLNEPRVPNVDAIYMGGGFPETHAPQLAKNKSFRNHLKALSENGLPVYAECGGLIFLGESICLEDKTYPMSGILPIKFGLAKRPQGHGYTKVEVVNKNPYFKEGEELRGHEFRYSSIMDIEFKNHEMAFNMERGKGILAKKDGFFKQNTFGTYTHIHALGSPSWAKALIRQAKSYRLSQKQSVSK